MTEQLSIGRSEPAEAGSLAREMGRAYRKTMEFYRDQLKLTFPDADKNARGDLDPEWAK